VKADCFGRAGAAVEADGTGAAFVPRGKGCTEDAKVVVLEVGVLVVEGWGRLNVGRVDADAGTKEAVTGSEETCFD